MFITYSLGCALYIITEQSTPNTQAKHVPPDAHFTPSPNNQHPTPKPNMFLQMRTLHHHRTINTQHPDQTCSLRCALYIITEQSTPNTQTKHVPSNAHFTSSPNNQHPTPKPNMFPRMRTLSSSSNNHHSIKHIINTQHSSPNTQSPCNQ